MHQALLNAMLASTCPSLVTKSESQQISLFTYDLHCETLWVIAKCIQIHGAFENEQEFEYEILGYKIVPDHTDKSVLDSWLSNLVQIHSIKWGI